MMCMMCACVQVLHASLEAVCVCLYSPSAAVDDMCMWQVTVILIMGQTRIPLIAALCSRENVDVLYLPSKSVQQLQF